jgi:hypothetical protein
LAVARAPSEDLWKGSRMRWAFLVWAREHTSWCMLHEPERVHDPVR